MNISSQDNLTRTNDKLSQSAYSVIISKPDTGIDCRTASAVTGFSITANQPSGTDIRLAFSSGAGWFALNTSGGAVSISDSEPSYSQLQASGNTVTQLKALTNIPAFAGKLIRAATALTSSDPVNIKPSIKLGVKASASSTSTSYTEYSPVYDLGGNASVSSVTVTSSTANGGKITVEGKLFREDGSESDWLSQDAIKGASGTALQLRCTASVTAVGTGSAALTRAEAVCATGGASGVTGSGEIYFVTEDWNTPVRTCRVNLRHSKLDMSAMTVYAAFRSAPSYSIGESLGTASGKRDTFNLAHASGIKADTFRLYSDGQELFSGFELNGAAGRVSVTASEGTILTCTYQYGWTAETWQAMALSSRNSLPDYDESEYVIENSTDASACSFMIRTSVESGTTAQNLAHASGHAQTVRLTRRCSGNLWVESGGDYDKATMKYTNAYRVDPKNYTLLDNGRLIRFACPAGELVRASYSWEAEPVRIYQAAAVFS